MNHNDYEGVYRIDGSQFEEAFYQYRDGRMQRTSSPGSDSTASHYFFTKDGNGHEAGWSTYELMMNDISENDYVRMNWAESIHCTDQEQILAVDQNHDLHADLKALLASNDKDLCIITVRYVKNPK